MSTLDIVPGARPELRTIQCTNPATREPLGTVPVTSPAEVKAAIARARAAQTGWAETDFAMRRAVLRRMADHLLANVDELVDVIVRDSGKTRENALMGEIWTVLEKLRWTIDNGEKHLRPERVSSGLFMHKRAQLEFHPLGVIGAILPWNYPLQNILNPLVPALMAGNAVVIKPSEWVAWSAERIADIAKSALVAEGQSPDLVQIVQGYGDTGQALIEGGIDSLVFIGSVTNGRRVLEAAARALVPVTLELGGKDPFVVCDDADLEQAAHAALAGCFISAGQNCVASERLLVFDAVYDRFAELVSGLVDGMRQGDPSAGVVDVGAMVTPLQLELVERLVDRAVDDGARVLAGGQRVLAERGDYFAPTVLANVTPQMDIMREETFGPVMVLCRVQDEHEAVAVANSTGYGLSSSVFSKDHAKARRIADRIHAGMAAINEFGGMTYMAQDLTFGGVKQSGFGRMNGREGLRSMCNVKAVLDDRMPLRLLGASWANKLFPIGPNDFAKIKAALHLVYGRGVRDRAAGIAQLAKALVGKK
jgi:acyl-CoA reductase-like NAD-dependent aldehyde dehydrogenase